MLRKQRAWVVGVPWFESLDFSAGVQQRFLPQPFKQWMAPYSPVTRTSFVAGLSTLPQLHSAAPKWVRLFWKHCHLSRPPHRAAALMMMRSYAGPGLDGISCEVLKLGGEASVQWLSSIFATIWAEESVPSDWITQLVVPIHKKGSQSDCDNFRGISLLSVPSKVFTKVISNHLKPRVQHLRESQCGFRKGRGCNDQIYTLRVLMEKAREFHQPLYMCFIDLHKAYDSVNRNALWAVLQ